VEESRGGALAERVATGFGAALWERSNEFEASAVADVAKAFEGVAAERALENIAGWSAVEKGAPLFEFADAVGSFQRVELRHAPVVDEFSAAHSVAKVSAPVVGFVDVGHCGGDAA